MSYKYVQKCNCCDEQISIIRISSICIQHKYELICLMHDALEALGVKGRLALACTDELIVAFNYAYANEAELKLSEQICDKLLDVASDFYWKQVSEPEINYYSV